MLENSNYRIGLITAKEAWSIRQPVLREGKPIEACIFDGDDFETTFHIGLFVDNTLIAVATFMKNSNSLFLEKKQFQLRGMAVLKEFQGKGYGNDILKFGESLLIKQGVKMIWCNARKIAVNFYQKNNYTIKGDSFIIPEIGIHYVMGKTL
ncbi:GNAT family N-acetyltransferase [Confluentibacter flavum]|uniref:GNAT family N-acetyltransferase n=1 Tax=Confluentibacter flavum TaxID=1909700 RepID=A0A2N3HGF5_9FLAO|nr:GNAT family N-acetyltransferase [Confluentibacter flavum]PKQ43984.1 GNAT family N-acetyltransferase [Confluentibacter flavum]